MRPFASPERESVLTTFLSDGTGRARARVVRSSSGVSGESSPSNRSGARVVQKNTNNNMTKREQRACTHISTLVGIQVIDWLVVLFSRSENKYYLAEIPG